MMPLLLVTSPPLSVPAGKLLERYFPGSTLLVWDPACPQDKLRVHRSIMAGSWALSLSFYNDYIFSAAELVHLGCVLNIHPALPSRRGRGYDTLPLIQRHSHFGATLHLVGEQIDSGKIVEVERRPMPDAVDYSQFRTLTQQLSLSLLESLLQRSQALPAAELSGYWIRRAQCCEAHWSGDFVSSQRLSVLLRGLSDAEPNHPILEQLPEHLLLQPV